MNVFAMVPVKKLDKAKSRLSSLLTKNERRHLCLRMLGDVLRAIGLTRGLHQTVVVSTDPRVLQTAKNLNKLAFMESKPGLNQAVSEAIGWCIQKGADSVLILPADIPLVTPMDIGDILSLGERAAVVLSPSRNGEGTNALLLTPPNVIPPCYGPDSFQKHIKEALKRGIKIQTLKSMRIALDIDTIQDLIDFASLNTEKTHAHRFLKEIGAPERLRFLENKATFPHSQV